jgi:hypothetical protein
MSYTSYSDAEKAIVRSGIKSIRAVLEGNDTAAKSRLLLCLDWFMDPYFGQDISAINDELVELLQGVVTSADPIDVKERAIQLLMDYTWGPYPILESHLGTIDEEILPDVKYIIAEYTPENKAK